MERERAPTHCCWMVPSPPPSGEQGLGYSIGLSLGSPMAVQQPQEATPQIIAEWFLPKEMEACFFPQWQAFLGQSGQ